MPVLCFYLLELYCDNFRVNVSVRMRCDYVWRTRHCEDDTIMTSSLTRVSGESEAKERKSSSSCFILPSVTHPATPSPVTTTLHTRHHPRHPHHYSCCNYCLSWGELTVSELGSGGSVNKHWWMIGCGCWTVSFKLALLLWFPSDIQILQSLSFSCVSYQYCHVTLVRNAHCFRIITWVLGVSSRWNLLLKSVKFIEVFE